MTFPGPIRWRKRVRWRAPGTPASPKTPATTSTWSPSWACLSTTQIRASVWTSKGEGMDQWLSSISWWNQMTCRSNSKSLLEMDMSQILKRHSWRLRTFAPNWTIRSWGPTIGTSIARFPSQRRAERDLVQPWITSLRRLSTKSIKRRHHWLTSLLWDPANNKNSGVKVIGKVNNILFQNKKTTSMNSRSESQWPWICILRRGRDRMIAGGQDYGIGTSLASCPIICNKGTPAIMATMDVKWARTTFMPETAKTPSIKSKR